MEIVSTFTAPALSGSMKFQPAGAPELEVRNYTNHVASVLFLGLVNNQPGYHVKLGEKYVWALGVDEETTQPFYVNSVCISFFDIDGVAALGGNQERISAIMSMAGADTAIKEEDSNDATTWMLVDTTTDQDFHPIRVPLMGGMDMDDADEVDANADAGADASDDVNAVNE